MTLPTTGPLSLSQVRTELSLSGSVSLGATKIRELSGATSGPSSLSQLRGKSAAADYLALVAGGYDGFSGYIGLDWGAANSMGTLTPGYWAGVRIAELYEINFGGWQSQVIWASYPPALTLIVDGVSHPHYEVMQFSDGLYGVTYVGRLNFVAGQSYKISFK